jgi:multiple sugar transport system substrate-binding protein
MSMPACSWTCPTWWDAGDFEGLASTKGAMTIDGKQWGVPYTYYQWGVYYREGHLQRAWPERARDLGRGAGQLPGDHRFGPQVLHHRHQVPVDRRRLVRLPQHAHQRLRLPHGAGPGEIPWTDDRVRQTFANWRQLIDMGAFIDDHQTYSWQEALPFMVNGEATAYLMGNFAVDRCATPG